MAITTAMCNSFKTELLGGLHDLDTDSLKIALIKASPSGTYNASTTNYSTVTGNSDEASGTNYTAGGQVLDGASITLDGSTAIVDFTDEVFSNVTVSADGCIIYNTANSNSAIAVIDFGGTVSATAGDLTIEFPAANASNAVIRIA
jgi:DeoR/GlpR family transcriptional regulator of sugar metabolism